jgi:energy-coupling factor transport system permease protein
LVSSLLTLALISQINFRLIFQFIKPILPLFLFLILFDGFFNTWGSQLLFKYGSINFYQNGAIFGLAMVCRMLTMVIATIIVLVTTEPGSIILALRAFGLPHKLAFMLSTAFRFVPTLMGKALLIQEAQKSRGLKSGDEAGNFIKRVLAFVPIIIPLFISSLELAQKLSLAMEARGFGASKHVTYPRDLEMHSSDHIILLTLVVVTLVATVLRLMGFGGQLLGTADAIYRVFFH